MKLRLFSTILFFLVSSSLVVVSCSDKSQTARESQPTDKQLLQTATGSFPEIKLVVNDRVIGHVINGVPTLDAIDTSNVQLTEVNGDVYTYTRFRIVEADTASAFVMLNGVKNGGNEDETIALALGIYEDWGNGDVTQIYGAGIKCTGDPCSDCDHGEDERGLPDGCLCKRSNQPNPQCNETQSFGTNPFTAGYADQLAAY